MAARALLLAVACSLLSASGALAAPSFTVFGSAGTGAGQFSSPRGVAVDADGNIYVADSGNHRIQKWSKDLVYLTSFGTQGSGNGQMEQPTGVAVDAHGNIYFADPGNDHVQKLGPTGQFLLDFGAFAEPVGVEVDAVGHVLVTDSADDILVKLAPGGTLLNVYGKPGGGPGSGAGEFDDPLDVDTDPPGDALVADSANSRVNKLNAQGGQVWERTGLGEPAGIGHDLQGHIWVTDHSGDVFRQLDAGGNVLATLGVPDPGSHAAGELDGPYGVDTDCTLAVFVADSGNDRMQRYGEPIDPGDPPCTLPSNTVSPELSGQPQAGSTLTLDPGAWSGAPTPTLSYRWQRCSSPAVLSCGDIAGERALAYAVSDDDRGLRLRALVVASNTEGTVAEPTDMTPTIPVVPIDPLPPIPPNPPPTPPTPHTNLPTVKRLGLARFSVGCPTSGRIVCAVRADVVGPAASRAAGTSARRGFITLARAGGTLRFQQTETFRLRLTRPARRLLSHGYNRKAVLRVFVDGKRRLTARVLINRRTATRFGR